MDDKTELFERIYKADNETLKRILNELRMATPKEPYRLLDPAHRIYTCTQEDAPGLVGLFQQREWRIILVRDRPDFENTLARVIRYMDEDIEISEYMNMDKDEEHIFSCCRQLSFRILEDRGAEFALRTKPTWATDEELALIPFPMLSVLCGLQRVKNAEDTAINMFWYGVACGKRIERHRRKPA